MSQKDEELVRRATEAFNQRDPEKFAQLLAPDAEIVPLRAAVEGTVYRGPDAAARFFADSDETWQSLQIEVDEIRSIGDTILSFGVLRGRGRGSGAAVEMSLAFVVRVRNGLATSFRTYTDRREALEAAGLRR